MISTFSMSIMHSALEVQEQELCDQIARIEDRLAENTNDNMSEVYQMELDSFNLHLSYIIKAKQELHDYSVGKL